MNEILFTKYMDDETKLDYCQFMNTLLESRGDLTVKCSDHTSALDFAYCMSKVSDGLLSKASLMGQFVRLESWSPGSLVFEPEIVILYQ